MEEARVTLPEMLAAREERSRRQRQLLEEHRRPLICFTMNIAGPVKTGEDIARGFRCGCELLDRRLAQEGIRVLYREDLPLKTGDTAYRAADADALALKRLTVELEDAFPLGRLFDMDVLDEGGRHIGREELGLPERTCLLCEKPAKECARSRAHTVEELWEHTRRMLREELERQDREKIAELACRSLLYEVCTTPKPGLVDRNNSGSHRDMDLFTFLASTAALYPYFTRCAGIGRETADLPPTETFRKLRPQGKLAELTMDRATGGVNTHKGAIFSVGVLCGALGRLSREEWKKAERVLSECAAMTRGLTETDFGGLTPETAGTTGEKLFVRYGLTGVRGQAEAGFPAVLEVGLPTLREGLKRGLSLNDAGCGTLLALMAAAVDTNLIARGGLEAQRGTAERMAALCRETPFPGRDALEAMDREFTERGLSPGGSADLLALTYFLYFLEEE